ncbi:phosphoribosyltransferase family protein [Blastococcus sp. BMG 814]|uniref:Phosphoribosyltransferase family protein n=1 Tax=Blastococcus carthaginiensis TaxID=3050034 RepID=A0ABT9IB24_9ACTN|nr:phosphoribosyltransferase family protein [Blastococcus carthaginiensis]MDP5182773.1 phosphoribosyltransferase family protein [Blastococcus carthaginiensis]
MGPGVLSALADLVLPRCCAGCGLPGAVLCARCARLLAAPHLASPRRFPAGFPPTVAAAAYAGPVRPVVNAFKEQGRAELAAPLGTALALAVAAVRLGVDGDPPLLLVPVPASRAALRSRGRDHVRELTRQAVAELRAAGVVADEGRVLRRRGRVRDSSGLSAAERRANLAGTFEVTGPHRPAGDLVVLVDDVVTTGATLTEAARVLGGAPGAAGPVVAAVVAATPRTPAGPPQATPASAGYRPGTVLHHDLDRLSRSRGRD